ncbi:MAG: methyltransferase domain-containing protein [Pseudomonadota bacterium]
MKRFYAFHARFYDLTRRFLLPRRKSAVRALNVRKGETVVDFACGTGLNLSLLFNAGADQALGLDSSLAMLHPARRKSPRALLVCADIRDSPLKMRVNKVICAYALSIIDDWEQALAAIPASLSDDGVLVVLDFSPLRGFLRPLNPLFRWWLRIWGTSAEKPIEKVLCAHFSSVRSEPWALGYAGIWIASHPKRT